MKKLNGFLGKVRKRLVKSGAVPFGSRVWGGYTNFSDHDFFTTVAKATELRSWLAKFPNPGGRYQIAEHKAYAVGYYIKDRVTRDVINVTGCQERDWPAWTTAAKMMGGVDCWKISVAARKALFETTLAILKQEYRK